MTVLADESRLEKLAIILAILAVGLVLGPFLILGEEYIFTVHDYLDSFPSYMRIVQKLPIIPRFDATSGIMNDMPAFYFCVEFNLYRFLNYFFDFVFAEFLNRTLSIGIGFFSTKYFLTQLYERDCLPYAIVILISLTYAISPVYPEWSLGFAVLPLLMAKLYQYWNDANTKITWHMGLFLLVGFFGSFPCFGLFVCFFWLLVILAYAIRYKEINKPMLLALILMSIGYGVTNVYLFIMAFSGVETNRLLMGQRNLTIFKEVYYIVREFLKGLFHGQYHAKPIVEIAATVCILGGIKFFSLFRQCKLSQAESMMAKKLWGLFLGMCSISLIYALDGVGIVRKVFSYVIPMLGGFNFERLLYLNNFLWYVLFAGIISLFVMHYKSLSVVFVIVFLQLCRVLFSFGSYRNTMENVFHSFFINQPNVISYQRFFDADFWNQLKNKMHYNNEKVVCVGFHPSVAIVNDFNTMDGYLSIHPLEHHRKFREIIAPTLDVYSSIRNYYDTWGGRMYVYADSLKNVDIVKDNLVEQKTLLINTEAFKAQGGKYVLSRYTLTNAADIGLKKVCEHEGSGSIYHIFVYQVIDNK